jgi:hypothetical protein
MFFGVLLHLTVIRNKRVLVGLVRDVRDVFDKSVVGYVLWGVVTPNSNKKQVCFSGIGA